MYRGAALELVLAGSSRFEECSCFYGHAQLGETAQSSFRSSQAPLLGFTVVCREKSGCTIRSRPPKCAGWFVLGRLHSNMASR